MGGIVVARLSEHGMRGGKNQVKICACIGFGRRMDLVSAWGRWDTWCE